MLARVRRPNTPSIFPAVVSFVVQSLLHPYYVVWMRDPRHFFAGVELSPRMIAPFRTGP
jgi:hypothetical protein